MPLGFVGFAWLSAFAQVTLLADRPTDLLASAAFTTLALLTALLAARVLGRVSALSTGRRWVGLRARSRGRPVPRQVDPDAAGRPRPRAPGHPSAA